MNNLNEFYNIARSFCLKIETAPKFEISNCKEFLLLLSKLYNVALQLPNVEPSNDVKFDVERICVSFEELDVYWEIYNPYECDAPVCGSLSDDFGDIYADLKTGVTLYEKGYVNGVSEGKFAPEKNITREQFVVILLRALGEELTAEGGEFSDVLQGSYYEKYVNTAYKRGIVNGIGGGMFGVGQNVSRQDFVTMIYRALKAKNIELKENKSIVQFTDNEQIADYAKEAVEKLVRAGAVNGFPDGTFNPSGLCTRAQAAKVIYEIVKEG